MNEELEIAIKNGFAREVSRLLEEGADPNFFVDGIELIIFLASCYCRSYSNW